MIDTLASIIAQSGFQEIQSKEAFDKKPDNKFYVELTGGTPGNRNNSRIEQFDIVFFMSDFQDTHTEYEVVRNFVDKIIKLIRQNISLMNSVIDIDYDGYDVTVFGSKIQLTVRIDIEIINRR